MTGRSVRRFIRSCRFYLILRLQQLLRLLNSSLLQMVISMFMVFLQPALLWKQNICMCIKQQKQQLFSKEIFIQIQSIVLLLLHCVSNYSQSQSAIPLISCSWPQQPPGIAKKLEPLCFGFRRASILIHLIMRAYCRSLARCLKAIPISPLDLLQTNFFKRQTLTSVIISLRVAIMPKKILCGILVHLQL